jgi:polysaccharide biosynthesis protein PslH
MVNRTLNILVVSTILPYPPNNGGAARLFNLYSRLGQRHHITWVCPVWQGHEKNLPGAREFCAQIVELPQSEQRPFPNQGWGRMLLWVVAHLHWERLFRYCFGYVNMPGVYWLVQTPERTRVIDSLVMAEHFDLVVSEFEGNAELIPTLHNIPRVIMLHNAQSTLFERMGKLYARTWQDLLFYYPELWKVIRYEQRNYRRYDLAIAVSEADRELVQRRAPGLPVELIPNGVDILHFQNNDQTVNPKTAVYVGHYGYPPNADAILYFARKIFPLIRQCEQQAELVVVGAEPPEELKKIEGVRVVGVVPDVRPFVAQAGVSIAPLRVGGGSRIKILEAFAMRKAVVATTLGAEGLEVTPGKDILIADDAAPFADAVVRVMKDSALRIRLGENGRRVAEQKYDWDTLAGRVEELFCKLARK